MNTRKGYRIFFALVSLTLIPALTIGNVTASPTLQLETDFATWGGPLFTSLMGVLLTPAGNAATILAPRLGCATLATGVGSWHRQIPAPAKWRVGARAESLW